MILANPLERLQVEVTRASGSDAMAHVEDKIFQAFDILYDVFTLIVAARFVIETFHLGGFPVGHLDDLLVRVAFGFLKELGDTQ
jgi:hypothetical protein